ncbi:MAG: phosphate acyltransferase PlsX [Caulobacterales bacterium]
MSSDLVISVDGMGGDNAPGVVVAGVQLFAAARKDVRILLHGDEARLTPLLEKSPAARKVSTIIHSPNVVAMDAKPAQALRRGKGTSMWSAIESVKNGQARVVTSAGNTGALMAMSRLQLRCVQGVDRPALAALWPTEKGACAVLDVGANVENDATELAAFAVMGQAYFRAMFGKAQPSVALLNVGAEDVKGHVEIREAARLLRESGIEMNFIGFVEGDDIGKGAADVIVTDGFTGNVALKTAEGTARFVAKALKDAFKSGPFSILGALIASGALSKVKSRLDPRKVNGAAFLGLNGHVVKSHGGTDALGFATALKFAANLAASNVPEEVEATLKRAPQLQHAPRSRQADAIPTDVAS